MSDLRQDLDKIHELFSKHKLINQVAYGKRNGITRQAVRYRVKAGVVKHVRLGETVFIIQ